VLEIALPEKSQKIWNEYATTTHAIVNGENVPGSTEHRIHEDRKLVVNSNATCKPDHGACHTFQGASHGLTILDTMCESATIAMAVACGGIGLPVRRRP
jgi:hypothetical protein